jgi:DNA-binding CsgD family transcriptional regulator
MPWARGRLREAQGRVADVRDAIAPLAEDEEAGIPMRSLAWRALLSRTLSRAGEGEEAAGLARAHLDWAETWGRPAALGVAQRAVALSSDGERRIELLEEAAATLGGSSLQTEEARARADLGIALLRAGRRGDGTRELKSALDMAMACGARDTARLASGELEVAGAAPRKLRFDELTASERRVAEMAAEGGTNREIAAELYVTPKTVENHLTRVYSKLGIESRAELATAL